MMFSHPAAASARPVAKPLLRGMGECNVTNAALTPSAIYSVPLVIIRFSISVQLVSNNLFPYHDG
jgi:hypothetical protein